MQPYQVFRSGRVPADRAQSLSHLVDVALSSWKNSKPDKLIRDALIIALRREAEDGKSQRLQAHADRIVDEALDGNVSTSKEVADQVDVKATQPLSAETDDGQLTGQIVRFSPNAEDGPIRR